MIGPEMVPELFAQPFRDVDEENIPVETFAVQRTFHPCRDFQLDWKTDERLFPFWKADAGGIEDSPSFRCVLKA